MTNISENTSSDKPKRGRGRPQLPPEKKAESAAAMRQRNPTKQIPETQEIHERFFTAFEKLIETGKLKSAYQFQKQYGINQGNFIKLRNSPEKFALPVIFLHYLVKDFAVSAHWLLTGEGEMMS